MTRKSWLIGSISIATLCNSNPCWHQFGNIIQNDFWKQNPRSFGITMLNKGTKSELINSTQFWKLLSSRFCFHDLPIRVHKISVCVESTLTINSDACNLHQCTNCEGWHYEKLPNHHLRLACKYVRQCCIRKYHFHAKPNTYAIFRYEFSFKQTYFWAMFYMTLNLEKS